VIRKVPDLPEGVRAVGVPFTAIAHEIGTFRVKNIVALGAMQAATELFPTATLRSVTARLLHAVPEMRAVNERAFNQGAEAYRKALAGGMLDGMSRN
jgi:2-oxoisovalerate ferredoxin oxidoreductase beta subunit